MSNWKLPWINSDNSLFDISGEIPTYLFHLNVSEIKWLKGNPKSGVKAIVTINEPSGQQDLIFNLVDGFAFEVLHREYGPPDKYVPEFVRARFSNCQILSKWVDDLVINNPDLIQEVSVFCQMRADFLLIR